MSSQNDHLIAQVIVLQTAVSAIAMTLPNRPAVLAYFEQLSERLMAELLEATASDESLACAQAHIDMFCMILKAPMPQPKKK